MTNPFIESTESDVLYPDDLPGIGLVEVLSSAPVDADDVDADGADYGLWCRVLPAGRDSEKWMACPRAIRALVGEAIETDPDNPVIEVTEATRGGNDHDPWEIEGRVYEEGDPV